MHAEGAINAAVRLEHPLFFRHNCRRMRPNGSAQDMIVLYWKSTTSRLFSVLPRPVCPIIDRTAWVIQNLEKQLDEIVSRAFDLLLIFGQQPLAEQNGNVSRPNAIEEPEPSCKSRSSTGLNGDGRIRLLQHRCVDDALVGHAQRSFTEIPAIFLRISSRSSVASSMNPFGQFLICAISLNSRGMTWLVPSRRLLT